MEPPYEGTSALQEYGIGWIVLKVIYKGRKGHTWLIIYLEAIFSKTV